MISRTIGAVVPLHYERIGYSLDESVATITLNRPERSNAFTGR